MKLNRETRIETVILTLSALLAVYFIVYSVKKTISDNERDIRILVKETTTNVSSIITIYNQHLHLLRSRAEEIITENFHDNGLLKKRLTNVNGKGWELLPKNDDSSTYIGRLTGIGVAKDIPNGVIQEIYMAENLNRLFARTNKNLPNAPFVYYISKANFWNLTPRHTEDFSFFIRNYVNYELFTLGLPKNNPTQKVFWTKPYIDAGGNGLMVSAGIPVYNHNQFVGNICIDMLFNDIANYLNSSTFANHNVSLIDNYSQVVSSTIQDLASPGIIPTLHHLIKDNRNNIEFFEVNKFVWYNNYLIFISNIPNTQWYILYFEARTKFIGKTTMQVLPVFVAVMFLLVIIYLLLYTNRLRIENQTARIKAEKANMAKNKFLSIIAHDLRGPFNSMLGFSDIMNKNFKNNNLDNQKKYFDYIHEGIKRLYKLLEDLLLWAKLQMEGITCNPEDLELNSTVDETIEPLLQSTHNKSIRLLNQVPSDIYLYSDKSMISTIIRNLVSNAIKFTPRNGTIIVSAINREQFVEIYIKDDGIGISKDKIDVLFDIGEKTLSVGTESESGSGLGLMLCKDLVEQQKGKIWVESEVGKGSTFYFTIPLKD
jgi:signal transduction histidine kinase